MGDPPEAKYRLITRTDHKASTIVRNVFPFAFGALLLNKIMVCKTFPLTDATDHE